VLKQLLRVDIRLKVYRLCFVNEENDADLQIWHETGEGFLQVLQIIPGCGKPIFSNGHAKIQACIAVQNLAMFVYEIAAIPTQCTLVKYFYIQ